MIKQCRHPTIRCNGPLIGSVILDFNRKASDHIESVSPFFVGVIAAQELI